MTAKSTKEASEKSATTEKEVKVTKLSPEVEKPAKSEAPKAKISVPSLEEMLKAGVQFGHETRRWNPKMGKYIHSSKNNIHIIDVSKTREELEKACEFLAQVANTGPIIVVGTKRQAASMVRELAIESGIHFIDIRWAGGILTNFKEVKKSLISLNSLEKSFEEGVEGRTKYEISRMKKEWARLERLYSGIKSLETKPVAVIVVDAKFEKSAVREAKNLLIPVIGMIDTNTDPDLVNFPIPSNDDAINSIKLIVQTLTNVIKDNNKDQFVKHSLKDYSKVEVSIIKNVESEEEETLKPAITVDEQEESSNERTKEPVSRKPEPAAKKSSKKAGKTKGILEQVQEKKDKSKKKA